MKIKNKDLVHVINFLDGLSIKGLKSIHRTNISNKLKQRLELFSDAQKQLQKEYKDDADGFQKDFRKLLEQDNTIDDADSKVEIESLKSVVNSLVADDSEHEFSDGDAIGLAAVYNALKGGDE